MKAGHSGGLAPGQRAADSTDRDPSGAPGCAAAVRSYLIHLVGPARAAPACERAFRELAEVRGGLSVARPEAETVRAAARAAGLDALEAEVGGVRRRLAGLAAGRVGCAVVVRRLRARAAGQMSVRELYGFYEHLERCDACADIASRFDQSEWALTLALRSLHLAESQREPTFRPSSVRELNGRSTSESPPEELNGRLTPKPTAQGMGWTRSRRPLQALVLAVGAAIAFVVAVLPTSKGPTRPVVIPPAARTTINAPPVIALAYSADRTFTLGGARFIVFADRDDRWATFTKAVPAGPGKRWELVTMNVENLSRSDFDPRVLHYRLLAGRVAYFPRPSYGTAPDARRPPTPVARGRSVDVELAFLVPTAASGLELAFDPLGQPARVTVNLGR